MGGEGRTVEGYMKVMLDICIKWKEKPRQTSSTAGVRPIRHVTYLGRYAILYTFVFNKHVLLFTSCTGRCTYRQKLVP